MTNEEINNKLAGMNEEVYEAVKAYDAAVKAARDELNKKLAALQQQTLAMNDGTEASEAALGNFYNWAFGVRLAAKNMDSLYLKASGMKECA